MKTADELDQLEKLAFETKLRGEALEAEFQKRKYAPVKPLYQPSKTGSKLKVYLMWLHKEIDGARRVRGAEGLPPFKEWVEEEVFHSDGTASIVRISPFTGEINAIRISLTREQFMLWSEQGVLLQNAFPHLDADQREFLKTGITADEWTKTFSK